MHSRKRSRPSSVENRGESSVEEADNLQRVSQHLIGEERAFRCQFCAKAFLRNEHLQRHERLRMACPELQFPSYLFGFRHEGEALSLRELFCWLRSGVPSALSQLHVIPRRWLTSSEQRPPRSTHSIGPWKCLGPYAWCYELRP